MQVIQSIRDKGAAIVIVVIALSLIGFILMDAKQGSNRLFASDATSIGKVNGNDITNEEYNNGVKNEEARFKSQYGIDVTGPMAYQVRQSAWDQLVNQKLMIEEFKKLGLSFTAKELGSILFSDEAPPSFKQQFTDKDGKYDIAKAAEKWREVKKLSADKKDRISEELIEPLKLQTLYTKYSSLISAATYYPKWMREKDAEDTKAFATISYVSVPYNVINDSSVKVSDEDIMAYINKYPKKYKQDGGRMISYVSFDANPSAADTASAYNFLNDLKPSFAVDSTPKAFVSRNLSAIKYDDSYIPKEKLNMSQKDSITALPVGGVFGPYLDGKNIVLAKMLGSKILPDSIKCRHILVKIADRNGEIRSDSAARKLIDSIQLAIQGGADFNEMVLKYSDDEGSKNNKGEYKFGSSSSLVDSFYNTVFYNPTGTKKIVKGMSQDYIGYHYIEVLDQWKFNPAYKIAFVAREVTPSDETVNTALAQATKLSGDARDIKALDAYKDKNGLKKVDVPNMIKENDYQLGGLQDARSLIRWAFGAKEGEVSEPFKIGEQFVVGAVTKIQKEGLPDVKIARPMVEATVRNLKKADEIVKKLGNTPTLTSAAQAYGKEITTAGADSTLTFGAQIINGIGQEPKVIGASFNKANQTKESAPIIGANGVYVIKVNSIGAKPADAPDVAAQQAKNKEQSMRQQSYGWIEGLKKIADIKDNRSKFN